MIVVGVDGSDGGAAALEFAADEAALRGVALHIVTAWDIPVGAYSGAASGGAAFGGAVDIAWDPATWDALRARAQQVAGEALATAKKLQPSLDVEATAVQGHAANALLDRSADAELIVVGRRGLGGFKTLLLGSVSQQIVQHATCPVVVMHQPATDS